MPPTPSTTLRRWLSIGLGLCFLFLALRLFSNVSYTDFTGVFGFYIVYIVAEGVLLALGTGLLRNKIWAQRTTVCLLLLAIFVVTFGVINPFTAGDMMMQGKDPSLPKMLAWIIPLDIGLLCLAWLLDPPRKNKG